MLNPIFWLCLRRLSKTNSYHEQHLSVIASVKTELPFGLIGYPAWLRPVSTGHFPPVFVDLGRHLNLSWMVPILYQFDHAEWFGFRFWDLVMPLFLFMTGASMPFSLARYCEQSDKRSVHKKIFRRFFILFLLGMVVQGNLLGLDPNRIYFYVNTLQAIATGYLIAALLLLHTQLKMQLCATAALLVIYWIPMTFAGDFTPEGNFAYKVDQLIMGRFCGDPTYTWIWSSLTFGVTVMLGTFAGRLMKNGEDNRLKVCRQLWLIGVALMLGGWMWSFQMPVMKRVWSSSMTLLSGGYCFLLMGLFYYWIDCKGHVRGMEWLKFYGMNSITAYMLGETVNFRCIVHSVSYGLERYLGEYYSVWLTFGNFLILFFILSWMYRRQIFLKI